MVFILGVATFVVPPVLIRKWKWVVPKPIAISYYIFLIASVIFGELFHFYYLIPNWDAYLHVFSGGLLAVAGFSVLYLLGICKNRWLLLCLHYSLPCRQVLFGKFMSSRWTGSWE